MRYFDLIAAHPLMWGLFLAYMVATAWLAWLGHKKTRDIRSFAIGRGDMSPWLVGITQAAAICSTATFVINPGFVFAHGVSALLHLGLSVGLGVAVGLLAMSGGFRRVGVRTGAITLPEWMGRRYGSRALAGFFAAATFLSLSFVVLIVGGVSIVLQKTLGLTNVEALVLTVGFVFSYVMIGGAYAHAYTNTLQGIIMIAVTFILLGSGVWLLADGIGPFLDRLSAMDPNLTAPINPASPLFHSFFSVFVCGFVIGFAAVCQPHIMSKALYVGSAKSVRKSILVSIAITFLFMGLLIVGLYARAGGMPPDTRQDAVMTVYITQSFPAPLVAVIMVALLAASMSTLDGILVAMASIAANDVFLPLARRGRLASRPQAEQARVAHRASQVILVAMGLVAFVIALHPPQLLGIFGQVGVYGLVAASAAPLLFGVLVPELGARAALSSAVVGVGLHFALYLWGTISADAVARGMANPAVTATWGILASGAVALPLSLVARARVSAARAGVEA